MQAYLMLLSKEKQGEKQEKKDRNTDRRDSEAVQGEGVLLQTHCTLYWQE